MANNQSKNISINITDELKKDSGKMFRYATVVNNIEFMKLFMSIADINSEDLNMALKQTVDDGNKEIAEFLIKNGADIYVDNLWCLKKAIENNNIALVELFLSNGLKLSYERISETIIKHIANIAYLNMCYFKDDTITKLLISSKAIDVQLFNTDGYLHSIARLGYLDVVKLLQENGLQITDSQKNFLLVESFNDNNIEFISYMLQIGADPICYNNEPIKRACYEGSVKAMKLLYEKGADIRVDGDFLICEAASLGNYEIVKFLLENGANPNANNGEPLRIARIKNHPEVVDLILNYK